MRAYVQQSSQVADLHAQMHRRDGILAAPGAAIPGRARSTRHAA